MGILNTLSGLRTPGNPTNPKRRRLIENGKDCQKNSRSILIGSNAADLRCNRYDAVSHLGNSGTGCGQDHRNSASDFR